MSKNKFCQSCGMPMSKDPKSGGTDKGGSKSEKYCSYCWKKGKFTDGGITDVNEYRVWLKNLLKEHGKGKFLSWLFTLGLGRLERWKK